MVVTLDVEMQKVAEIVVVEHQLQGFVDVERSRSRSQSRSRSRSRRKWRSLVPTNAVKEIYDDGMDLEELK